MEQTSLATVVARMKQLRQQTGMSAARLAEEMTRVGIPWRREVVAKLETGRRDTLDVGELLALAVVFGVPPTALLVDPTSATATVVPSVKVPTANALLWMLGEQPLQTLTGVWMDEQTPISLVRRLHELVARSTGTMTLLELTDHHEEEGAHEPDAAADLRRMQERQLVHGLRELSRVIREMRDRGMAVPPWEGLDRLDAAAKARGTDLGLQLVEGGR